ncbi:MAG: MFS transporter [candidate division Zixibacteria bacterium]|jgi:MFS family permease|nr:MFS transporter [candidate division Zixibacteria bacterium]
MDESRDSGRPRSASSQPVLNRNLLIIFGITLMAVLGVSSVTPAFPRMAEELGVSVQSITLLITVFTLPGIVLTPIFGVLADRYGRKRIIVPSLLVFALAGGSCSLVREFEWLLVFRFLQGVGGASIMSLNTTVIGDLYTGDDRRTAMGYNSSVLSIGTASYPLIGGALASFAWYYPFLLPLAAIPVAFVVLFLLNNPEPRSRESLRSYFGNIRKAMSRRIAGIYLGSFISFFLLYGSYLAFFPFLIRSRFDGTPMTIGLVMSSMSITTAMTSSQLGRLSRKYRPAVLLTVGSVMYTVALVSMPLIPRVELLVIPAMMFGFGQGMNLPNLQAQLATLAPMEYRAAFMSANAMVLRTGQTLGPLALGAVFSVGGLSSVFFAGAVCALILLLVVWGLIADRG